MKLSLLLIVFALAPVAGAFVPPLHHHRRVSFVVLNGEVQEREQTVDNTAATRADDKIKQEFEFDENSPAKMEAAARGQVEEQKEEENKNAEEKKDKKFDPLSLWTSHSGQF